MYISRLSDISSRHHALLCHFGQPCHGTCAGPDAVNHVADDAAATNTLIMSQTKCLVCIRQSCKLHTHHAVHPLPCTQQPSFMDPGQHKPAHLASDPAPLSDPCRISIHVLQQQASRGAQGAHREGQPTGAQRPHTHLHLRCAAAASCCAAFWCEAPSQRNQHCLANATTRCQQCCYMCPHCYASNTSMPAPHPTLQLRDFYGPLLATVTATKSAYDAMVRQHSSENTAQGFQAAVRAAPEGEEAKAYRWALGTARQCPAVLLACSLLLLAQVHTQFITRHASGPCAQPHRTPAGVQCCGAGGLPAAACAGAAAAAGPMLQPPLAVCHLVRHWQAV